MRTKPSSAMRTLEKLNGGPLTFGQALEAIRAGEDMSQAECARRLGVSRAQLCDIEKGRRAVSPERAVRFARVLGYGEKQFVRLALQDQLRSAGLRYKVSIDAA